MPDLPLPERNPTKHRPNPIVCNRLLERCDVRAWLHYLGYLDGYDSTDPEAEPPLTAQQIIAILTGQTDPPGIV